MASVFGFSSSSTAPQDLAKVEFNYEAPVINPNGRVTIKLSFSTDTGPINKALAIAKNSEVPEILKARGHLTAAEEVAAQYHRCIPSETYYIGEGTDAKFTAKYWDEKAIFLRPKAYKAMKTIRDIVLRRGEGSTKDMSHFETLIAGGTRLPAQRAYRLGATVNPQEMACGAAATNRVQVNHTQDIAEVVRNVAILASDLLEGSTPSELFQFLSRQADVDVPFTFGHESNRFFTSLQFNYSSANEASLEIEIGEVGGLHVDAHDDPRRWTVLLGLSNIPEQHWPGRTLITSLRIYAIMAPFTALVFQAVHPHISLGPLPTLNSKRQPYVSSVPGLARMDPSLYIFCRLICVCYAKKSIMDKTSLIIRHTTPNLLLGPNGLASDSPDSLSAALNAFGTLRNQFEFQAMIFAVNKARLAQLNPSVVLPTATAIAKNFRWKEGNTLCSPRIERIQAVLDGNADTPQNKLFRQQYKEYEKQCMNLISQDWFPVNKKAGCVKWVTELGCTFKDMEPNLADNRAGSVATNKAKKLTVAQQLATFGRQPFKCDFCDKRYKALEICRQHHERAHPDFEWQPVTPSVNNRVRKASKAQETQDSGDDTNVESDEGEGEEKQEDDGNVKKRSFEQMSGGETRKRIQIILR